MGGGKMSVKEWYGGKFGGVVDGCGYLFPSKGGQTQPPGPLKETLPYVDIVTLKKFRQCVINELGYRSLTIVHVVQCTSNTRVYIACFGQQ